MRHRLKAHSLLYKSISLLCYHIVYKRKGIEVKKISKNEVLETFLFGYNAYLECVLATDDPDPTI